jgi:hypothetical protein
MQMGASRKACGLAAAVALALSAAAPAARAVTADPSCRVTTYYANADKTIPVGSASTCPGSKGETGSKSGFVDVELIAIINGRKQLSLPAGSLTCEYQADCISDLATPMVIGSPAAPAKNR